jgi:hypothetical protein
MDVKVMLSETGKSLLIVNGFKVCEANRLCNGQIRWRCINKKSKCPAKVYSVTKSGNQIIQETNVMQHNHEKDPLLQRQVFSNSVKRKDVENP